ncbi:MAG: hydantoinase/oxoprolinase family protein [Candidatus Binatia bacterium]
MSRHTTRRGMQAAPAIVGVDTGGTFTDLIAFVGGDVRAHKVLSTPQNPALAVLRGLKELLPETLPALVTYGSTVATNALLERRGARVALVTTAGFEDVLEIGRQNRPALYDLEPRPPQPLVPRRGRIGVAERMAYDGQVLQPLHSRAVDAALRFVRRYRPQAVAVCLLHAYANPRHERMIGAALAKYDALFCSLSHQLVAEYREYERLSTTVINAYVGPVMHRHLRDLQNALVERRRPRLRLRIMQSNGGAMSAGPAGREAVRTVLSGPAGGVVGARAVARVLGLRRVITFDMGGTSTDVSLIDGELRYRSEWTIGGLPVKVPAIDMQTVGAGGGSLAWIDAGGALKVGPQSAGADPGPACYGRGRAATVTDANVLLGRLVAGAFLGGRMELQPARAQAAIERLCPPRAGSRQLTCEQAAEGVIRVVNASMERAIRSISVERGHDPREYTLIAFGGAAGQHACELSAALGIRQVVVPLHPGLLSAWGAAWAQVERDYVRTVLLADPSAARLRALFAPLDRVARRDLQAEGVPPNSRRLVRSVDARYRGQSHEIALPLSVRLATRFHQAHRRLYGYADPQRPIEIVNLRVRAVGRSTRRSPRRFKERPPVQPGKHRVRWQGRWLSAAAVLRPHVGAGTSVPGPAVIVEFSATTFVPPGWRAHVHRTGHLVLSRVR